MKDSVAVNFWKQGESQPWAFRRLYHVPRVGDVCVFKDVRFLVTRVEWCLDEDATDIGTRVNVELKEEDIS